MITHVWPVDSFRHCRCGAAAQYFSVIPGLPTPTESVNIVQIFQSTVCSAASQNPFCAALPAGFTTPGVARTAQYLPGRVRFNDQTFVGFGPILPFTLAVEKGFEYATPTSKPTVERS